jgi:hypothetical protein
MLPIGSNVNMIQTGSNLNIFSNEFDNTVLEITSVEIFRSVWWRDIAKKV